MDTASSVIDAPEASVVRFEVWPRSGFGGVPEEVRATPYAATFHFAARQLAVWTSFPVRIEGDTAVVDFTMGSGDEIWAVIGGIRDQKIGRARGLQKLFASLGMSLTAICAGFVLPWVLRLI